MNDGGLVAEAAPVLLQRARDALQRKDYEFALRCAERVIAGDPTHPDGYYIVGRIHSAKSELGPAIRAYRRTLELDPSNADAWTALGVALRSPGRSSPLCTSTA